MGDTISTQKGFADFMVSQRRRNEVDKMVDCAR
jgi:hypothetical protein